MTGAETVRVGEVDDYLRLGRTTTLRVSPRETMLAYRRVELDESGRAYSARLVVRELATGEEWEIALAIEPAAEFAFADESTLLVRGRAAGQPWALWAVDLTVSAGADTLVAAFPGDVTDFALSAAGVVVLKVKVLSTAGLDEDLAAASLRASIGTSAIRHTVFPVRAWDHDLGPHRSVLVVIDDWRSRSAPRLLTPGIGRELDGQLFDLSEDGSVVVTGWHLPAPEGGRRSALMMIDVAEGARRMIADEREVNFEKPRISPNGRFVACERMDLGSFDIAAATRLWVIHLETGEGVIADEDFDLWPVLPRWAPTSDALYFTAEAAGRRPVFCIDVEGGRLGTSVRLTADDGCYSEITAGASGAIFALRGTLSEPPVIISLDAGDLDQRAQPVGRPPQIELPGTLTEIFATASDGQSLRGSLLLPTTASAAEPAPLVMIIHGGPEQSWVDWAPWGYNPWIFVEQGYAVLLPDPAHSSGYGQEFVQRGWGAWGGAPYTDLMDMLGFVLLRPEIDAHRTAAIGHSFGGYMANWIAGQDGHRFDAIVSHSGLYDLERFADITDRPAHWARRFGSTDDPGNRYERNSPRRGRDRMCTPMLIVHGDMDYRVPVTESISLWRDLVSRGIPGEFLYFPDENHYILKPGNTRVWYETILEFLADYVPERR